MRRMVLHVVLLLAGLLALAAPATVAQITPPAPGVDLPPEVLRSIDERGEGAFQFKRAWIEKARAAREARERFVEERGFYQPGLLADAVRREMSVTGTFAVPVFCVKYSNTGADPFPIATVQTKLYDGPYAPRTLTAYYDEISYGALNLTGTVYGWTTLPNPDSYYAGAGTCNGLCETANIDDLIISALTANDGAVDFGDYDNDGPDGLPNSGDDDGYVDFAAFVHPEAGAECGINGNIWSHRYSLSGWTGSPFVTNDARNGGGVIRVDDYVIQPIYNCDGTNLIDIGVFCHEYGHAFGLPDLYDVDGGSQGVGHWCLMGSGSWNTPSDPAHMSAWSKDQLGWVNVVQVSGKPSAVDVDNVELNPTVYRLDVTDERWRRLSTCPLSGSWSMTCGLLAAEAAARNWAAGEGYGNGWDETVSRQFFYDGGDPVALSYEYEYSVEPGYDYVYGTVTSGATTSTFVTYSGSGAGAENIDLTPYLTANLPYTVSFRVTSDVAWSDEDGLYATACAPMRIDDLSVVGGGENYFTDFETREDGWAPEMTPPNEYFMVENRQPLGSDTNVWGGGGLAIWHVERSVTRTGQSGNTGGSTNTRPRGVALEQADALLDLENNVNRGDAGDAFPGSTNNVLFDNAATPNSKGYGNNANNASVQLTSGNGDPISATMSGGWPAPTVSLFAPATGPSGATVQIQADGSGFAKTGSAELVLGATTIVSTNAYWVGKDRVFFSFDLTGAPNGFYDLVVYNPGGSCTVVAAGFEVTGAPTGVGDNVPARSALLPNYPNPFNPATTIRFDVAARADVTLRVYDVNGALVRTLVDDSRGAGSYRVEWDGRDDRRQPVSSGVYFYRLAAGGFSDVRKMTLLK